MSGVISANNDSSFVYRRQVAGTRGQIFESQVNGVHDVLGHFAFRHPTNEVLKNEKTALISNITVAASPPFLETGHFEAVFGRISPYNLPLAWRKWFHKEVEFFGLICQ